MEWVLIDGGEARISRIGGAAEPKLGGLDEFLLRHVKSESERFLQHRGSAKRRNENGVFRFGGEVEDE